MRAGNLLTPEMRSTPKGTSASAPTGRDTSGGIGAFVVLGALALVVAALAGYVLSDNVIKARKAELAQMSSRSESTVARANALKPYADFETVARNRVGTVHALAGARFDWDQKLRDISRAMPKDVFLNSLDGTVGGAATSAGAPSAGATSGGSSLSGPPQAPAITLKGCTRSQPAVATLMSRMRNVQGVTRVSLAKSDKDSGSTGTSGTNRTSGADARPPGT